jgi:hypothetical protein
MTDIEELRILLCNKRWQNEIDAIEENDDSDDDELIEKYKKNIKKKVKPDKKISTIIKNNNKDSKSAIDNKDEIDPSIIPSNATLPMFQQIDYYLYKKPWLRLQEFHKLIKIREYINSLNIKDNEKKNLIELLEKKLKNKELKNKQITYVPKKEVITKISGVSELNEYLSDDSTSDDD